MAKSTGIVLTATAISFTNEWLITNKPNFRVLVAGGGAALLLVGVEQINEKAGVGLAVIMLITILVTPFNGQTPVQALGIVGSGTAVGSSKDPNVTLFQRLGGMQPPNTNPQQRTPGIPQ